MALVPIALVWLALMWFVFALCRSARMGDRQLHGEQLTRAASNEAIAARDRGAPAKALSSPGGRAGVLPARAQRVPRRAARPSRGLARTAGARR
jgi:hypothetical protein